MPELDTFNEFLVSAADNDSIVFLRPLPQRVSKEDALLLAAYLVALVADRERWEAVLTAVENS